MSSKSNYIKKFLIILHTIPGEVPKCVNVFKDSQLPHALHLYSELIEKEVKKTNPGKVEIVSIDVPTNIMF